MQTNCSSPPLMLSHHRFSFRIPEKPPNPPRFHFGTHLRGHESFPQRSSLHCRYFEIVSSKPHSERDTRDRLQIHNTSSFNHWCAKEEHSFKVNDHQFRFCLDFLFPLVQTEFLILSSA